MKHSNASFFVILLAVSVLSACGTAPAKYDRSVLENFSRSSGDYGGPALTESLFNYKDRTLSEEDIRRILDGQIGVRDSVRLRCSTMAARWRVTEPGAGTMRKAFKISNTCWIHSTRRSHDPNGYKKSFFCLHW